MPLRISTPTPWFSRAATTSLPVSAGKQAGDPAWADDAEVEFMKIWVPNDNPGDFVALSGYINVQAIAQALTKCGDDLTRESLLKQATSMKGARLR